MKCYKGFDKDLKCRGFQYEIGKEYEENTADICHKGFHACENPMDVFGYYDPADSRYCEVDLDTNEQTEEDSKRVGKKIKIETEIGLSGLIQAGVKFILEKVDFKSAKENNTGYPERRHEHGIPERRHGWRRGKHCGRYRVWQQSERCCRLLAGAHGT